MRKIHMCRALGCGMAAQGGLLCSDHRLMVDKGLDVTMKRKPGRKPGSKPNTRPETLETRARIREIVTKPAEERRARRSA